jgi:hypothetical protein
MSISFSRKPEDGNTKMKRLGLVFAVCIALMGYSFAQSIHQSSANKGWNVAKVGAGGFITGYDVSKDGTTRVIRTDTYGGYIWNARTSKWDQITTSISMPAQAATPNNGNYIYEVVVAANKPNRLYMWWHGLMFRSDDRAVSWSHLSNYNGGVKSSDLILLAGGGQIYGSRLYGKKMAVDPVNADVVISGSYIDGISMSTNAGASWISLTSSIPKSSVAGYKLDKSYPAGTNTISVDTGTAGIAANTQVFFDNGSTQSYTVISALASGSGNVTISPALNAPVSKGTSLLDGSGFMIAFDPSSAVNCGVDRNQTCGIYVASYGNGVYHSTDGGLTWSKTSGGTGGSITFKHLVVASDGIVYTLDNSGNSVIQKYASSIWSDVSAGNGQDAIAVDPNNPARVVGVGGGFLFTSLNRGRSWALTAGAHWSPNCLTGQASQKRVATDAPWLAWTQECIMTTADARFDPVLPGTTSRLWIGEGIGVWYYDFGSTTAAPSTQIAWTSQSAGIEQIVANWIISPPGGKPTFYGWDRPVFYIRDPTTYPSTHGPNALVPINHGWSASYAPSDPTTIAAIFNWYGGIEYSGISTDGGQTWTKFASVPANVISNLGIGGSIAMSTSTNILWCPNNNNAPSYTIDGGATWNVINLSGVPPDKTENGWGFAYFTNHQVCAADQVNANEFYMFNYGPTVAPTVAGIYRSKDSGATWTRTYAGSFPGGGTNDKLRAVPGHAGHLFYTAGPQGSPPGSSSAGNFYRSTNSDTAMRGMQRWQPIANVSGVIAFGFGKAKAGGDYPTLYIAGYVDGVYGIWRGDGTVAQWAAGGGRGTAVTWTNLGANPLNSFDVVKTLEGDGNTYGVLYIGWSGSGFAYYVP